MLVKSAPSIITLANLVLGMVALALCLQGRTPDAAVLVVVGMVLDGIDGRVARWLHAESEFGRQLDSLSDMVTFGAAPAAIMYVSILRYMGNIGLLLTVLFPVAGALRLARFHVQKGSNQYFVGLPITAAGGILATFALYKNLISPMDVVLPLITLGLSFLMVSQVRYPNFKKVAFPQSAVVGVPLLAVLVFLLFQYHLASTNRLVFLPLAVYAVVGIGFALRRRYFKDLDEKADVEILEEGLEVGIEVGLEVPDVRVKET
ncbi:CDP-diacylglycerol--serine O-phosphatidyltransferase [Alicyclobacillaceae bacterium I2511]|nr:CDP-diacylglycerol--serine O-phosphatidyltransferase [Alicyclobacillaceae bacterium I2511]